MDALEIVILVLPEFVIVTDFCVLLPVCTVLKLRLDGDAVSAPAATAVPDNGILSDAFEALLVMVTLPVGVPAVCGANLTVNDVVAPAATVNGVVNPESVYPVPVMVAPEIVTLALPEFVRTSVKDCAVPVCTEPKLKLAV